MQKIDSPLIRNKKHLGPGYSRLSYLTVTIQVNSFIVYALVIADYVGKTSISESEKAQKVNGYPDKNQVQFQCKIPYKKVY